MRPLGTPSARHRAACQSIGGSRSYALDAADACTGSPSGVAQALTVGATDAADRRPAFSNYGRRVDISAPGVSVVSAWKGAPTALARASGTSMAAPHAAGVAALILAHGTARTPAQVNEVLVHGALRDRITGLPAETPNLLLRTPTDL